MFLVRIALHAKTDHLERKDRHGRTPHLVRCVLRVKIGPQEKTVLLE
jgi:hypothetical protein